jgi:hypothetical protein
MSEIMITFTTPPNAPSTSDPDNFDDRGDAFLGYIEETLYSELNQFKTEMNDSIDYINSTVNGYFKTSSTTSVSIGTDDKTFTVDEGKAFYAGMPVKCADNNDPTTNYMDGVVKSYSSGTLVVTVESTSGSGTISDWEIGLRASDVSLDNVPNEDATDPANWDPSKADGNFLVGNGSTFVAESGSTARASLGLGSAATSDASDFASSSHNHDSTYLNEFSNLSDLSNASSARSNLGLGTQAVNNQTISTSDPSGGSDGDVWYKVE